MASPEKKNRVTSEVVWREARELIWAHRGKLAVGMLLMVVNRLAGLVLPTSSKFLIDRVLPQQRVDLLGELALAVGLMMGRLGTIPVAAHQVAINLASLTFMVPLGVGQAAAVLVGHAIGAADQSGARRAARASVVYGVGFMALTSIVFLLVPTQLATLYTNDVATIALAAALLPVAGVFQLFDGTQAVTAGILRGAGDTRVPMLINLGGFWLFGIPLSLLLGFRTSLGPVGLWWGLAAALAIVAAILTLRVNTLLRRPITRVMIEQVPADLRT